jgi:hypothetical protein
MAIERLFQEKIEVNASVVASLVYVVGGVALYTSHDLDYSAIGTAYMALNMLSAILERILQRKMIAVEPIDVSKSGMMLLNNAVSLLPMGILLVYFGEHTKWARFRDLSLTDLALLLASCLNAIGISYAGINAQAYVTATTFMVLSNVNKVSAFRPSPLLLSTGAPPRPSRGHRSTLHPPSINPGGSSWLLALAWSCSTRRDRGRRL